MSESRSKSAIRAFVSRQERDTNKQIALFNSAKRISKLRFSAPNKLANYRRCPQRQPNLASSLFNNANQINKARCPRRQTN